MAGGRRCRAGEEDVMSERPTIETEGDAWHALTEPDYDWPAEASERVIATLTAARCRDCDGSGEVPTGRRIPPDLFGPAEPILTRCPTCDGTGYPESETA
jgi:hypothetical protein